jgi:excisionase family DNA binding protein
MRRQAKSFGDARAQQRPHDLQADVLRPLVDAIPALMDDRALQELAQRLQPLLTSVGQSIEPNNDGRLLTCAEAASYARVHVETIRRAVRTSAIPVAARIGRSPRISQVGLDQWLHETSRSAAGPVERRPVHRRPTRPERSGSLKDAWS